MSAYMDRQLILPAWARGTKENPLGGGEQVSFTIQFGADGLPETITLTSSDTLHSYLGTYVKLGKPKSFTVSVKEE